MRIRVVVAIVFAVTLSCILLGMPAQAFTIFGDYSLEVNATVFNSCGPCQEDVHIEGTFYIVIVRSDEAAVRQPEGVAAIMVHIILADGNGVGALTGARYLATGMITMRQPPPPPREEPRLTVMAHFAWHPLGACRLQPSQRATLPVRFELVFEGDGSLRLVTLLDALIGDAVLREP